jgi:hypothetical protein
MFFLFLFLYFGNVWAQSITDEDGLEYDSLDARKDNLPLLKLPYGTWQASQYDDDADVTSQPFVTNEFLLIFFSLRYTGSKTFALRPLP